MKNRIRNFKDIALETLRDRYHKDRTLEDATNFLEGLEYALLGHNFEHKENPKETLLSADEADKLFNEKMKALPQSDDDLAFDKVLFWGYVAYFYNKDKTHKDALLKLINKDCRDHIKYIVSKASDYQKIRSEHLCKSSFFELYSDQIINAPEVCDFIDEKIDWVENRAQAICLVMSEFLFIQSNLTISQTPPSLASNASMRLTALLAKYNVSPFAFRVILPFLDAQANGFATQLDNHQKSTQKHFYSLKKIFTFISSLKISCDGDFILPFIGMSSQACLYIGISHMTGNVLPFNPDLARLWIRMSALMGNPLAYYYDAIMNNSIDYNSAGSSLNFINEIYFALSLHHYANCADRRYCKTFKDSKDNVIDVHDYLLYNLLVALAKKCIVEFRSGSLMVNDLNIFEYSRYGIEAFHIMLQMHDYRFAAPLLAIHALCVDDLPFLDEGFANALIAEGENYDIQKDHRTTYAKILNILYENIKKAVDSGDVFSARVLASQNELFSQNQDLTYSYDHYLKALSITAKVYDASCQSLFIEARNDPNNKEFASETNSLFERNNDDMFMSNAYQCVQRDLYQIDMLKDNSKVELSHHLLRSVGSNVSGGYYLLAQLNIKKAEKHTLLRFGQLALDPKSKKAYDDIKESGEYKPLPFMQVIDEMCDLAYHDCFCAAFLSNIFEEGRLVPRNIALSHYYASLSVANGFSPMISSVKMRSFTNDMNYHKQFLQKSPIFQTGHMPSCDVSEHYHKGDHVHYTKLVVKLYKAILNGKSAFEYLLINIYLKDYETCYLLRAIYDSYMLGFITDKSKQALDTLVPKYLSKDDIADVSYSGLSSLFCMRDLSSYTVESYLSEDANYNIEGNSAYLYLSHLSSLFTMAYSSMLLDFKIKEEDDICQALDENIDILDYIEQNYDTDGLYYLGQIHFMFYRLALRSHIAAPNVKLAKFCLQQAVNRDLPLASFFEDQDLSIFDSVLDIAPVDNKATRKQKVAKKAIVVSKVAQ